MTRRIILLCIALAFPGRGMADEEGPSLNATHKAKIFMAGLSLVRGIATAAAGEVLVLVVGDCETGDELLSFENKKLNGAAVRYARSTPAEALAAIAKEKPSAAFLCSGSKNLVAEVVSAAEKHRIVTLSDDSYGVQQGLLLGIEVRGARAGMVLNAAQAKAIGVDFDPRIYANARVIK